MFFVCYDMNVIFCILKGFSLYNFGNKFVFIVIVFIVNICSCVENECKWIQMLTLLIEVYFKKIYFVWHSIVCLDLNRR